MDENLAAWDAWETLFMHWVRPGDGSAKTHLGCRSPRKCKFCGCGKSATSFRSAAHVIPAAFGNRSLFSFDECDQCNQVGSRLEDDLAKFFALPRVISQLPARSGSPKIKHPNQANYLQCRRDQNLLYVYHPEEGEGIEMTDDGNGHLRLKVETPKHRPVNVAKALARMLLFELEPQCPGFERVRAWVRGEVDWFPIPLVAVHLPGPPRNIVGVMGHRYTKAAERTIYRVGFLCSSFLLLMPIPMDDWSLPSDLPILRYPEPIRQFLVSNTSVFMLRHDSVEKRGTSEVWISYANRRETKRPAENADSTPVNK